MAAARQWSCGTAMFSEVFVCGQGEGGVMMSFPVKDRAPDSTTPLDSTGPLPWTAPPEQNHPSPGQHPPWTAHWPGQHLPRTAPPLLDSRHSRQHHSLWSAPPPKQHHSLPSAYHHPNPTQHLLPSQQAAVHVLLECFLVTRGYYGRLFGVRVRVNYIDIRNSASTNSQVRG